MRNLFILFLFLTTTLSYGYGQVKTITGTVKDSQSLIGLPGVTISKSDGTGSQTDAAGQFSIEVSPTDSLTFRFIGYTQQTVTVGDQEVLDVFLISEDQALEEVVVIGYGTANKNDLTAPVTDVDVESLTKRTTANPMQALQGSVSGVQVVTTGAPGSSPTVRIRGVGSLNNENPLYVVDGMFVDNIDFLNSNDIENMSILKDASGAAIYGVRAANGVVIITTKKGKMNMRTRVNYEGYVGFQSSVNMLRMANGEEYAAMQLAKRTRGDSLYVINSIEQFGGNGLVPRSNTDWYGELLRNNAPMHSHSLDIMGGTEKINYSFGANLLDQEGIMDAQNNYKRYNLRFQMEAQAFDWLKLGFTAHLNNSTLFSPDNGA